MSTSRHNCILASLAVCILTLSLRHTQADQLQMQNGDRYVGKILSVTSNAVVLQSEILGKVTLPRDKVSALAFGSGAVISAATTATAPPVPAVSPNITATNADLSTALRSLGANTNFIQQVREQMLAGADPAANQKYDEMVNGLLSGKLSLNDLRNEAKTSIDQINQLKRELGPDAGDALDSYLSILQSFVNETPSQAPVTPSANARTTAPAAGVPSPSGDDN